MLKKLNYVFLFAKYFIYTNKLNSKEVSLKEFVIKLEKKYRYCIEVDRETKPRICPDKSKVSYGINPFTAMGDLIDFTLSNARRLLVKVKNLAAKGLKAIS